MSKTKINVGAWSRVPIGKLSIAPSLAGASHTFSYENALIEIRLPAAPKRPNLRLGRWDDDRIWCSSWRTGSHRPICFEVKSVDVFVDLRRRFAVPEEALGRVRLENFSATESTRLQGLLKRGEALVADGVDRWLRVLRWRSLRGYIGRPERSSEPVRGADLVDFVSKRRFYSGPISVIASVSSPLPKRVWKRVGAALAQGLEPPIWYDFLFEGEHRLAVGDRTGGVIHLAISAESLLREVTARKHARSPTHSEFRGLLNQVSVSRILDRWKALGFRSPGRKNAVDVPALKRLFEVRNRLMHRGDVQLDATECRALAKAVRNFVLYTG